MEKYNITVGSKDSDNQRIEITLRGELTVSHIDTIRNEILKLSKGSDYVRLNVSEITMIDLSFLQLLISMKKSEGEWVKEFTAELKVEEEFNNLITTTGFNLKI